MTKRIKEILNSYQGEKPGVLTNLARMLNYGQLADTTKMIRKRIRQLRD